MIPESIQEGLTFDDILLVPARSSVVPAETDARTMFTRKVALNIPITSSAMDTVTESHLAIALAREGGIGVVHKNMSIERQVEEVDKVKRSESGMIVDPVTIYADQPIADALDLMSRFRISGVPNEALRDFCRTLRNVGCGYYPNSVFVHMDTRATSAFWIDYSRPGEPPHYNAPNLGADEGTSDVGDESHVSAPSEANAGTDPGAAIPLPGSNATPPPPPDPALNPAN